VHTLQGHTSKVSCCAWSPDDSQLLTAGYDRTVKLWDVKVTPESLRFFFGFFPTLYLNAMLTDSSLFSNQTAVLKSTFQRHNDVVSCLAWLPDGERFVSGSDKNLFLMVSCTEQSECCPSKYLTSEFFVLVVHRRHASIVAVPRKRSSYFI